MKRNEIEIGNKIGRLTVLEELEDGRYLCRCECGNEVIRSKRVLTEGGNLKCSNKCPVDAIGETRRGSLVKGFDPETKSYILECPRCGKEFALPYAMLKKTKNNGNFCPSCLKKGKEGRVEAMVSGRRKYLDDKKYFNLNKKGDPGMNGNVKGVSFDKDKGCYRAYVFVNKKRIHIGYYNDINDAIKARLRAEEDMLRPK